MRLLHPLPLAGPVVPANFLRPALLVALLPLLHPLLLLGLPVHGRLGLLRLLPVAVIVIDVVVIVELIVVVPHGVVVVPFVGLEVHGVLPPNVALGALGPIAEAAPHLVLLDELLQLHASLGIGRGDGTLEDGGGLELGAGRDEHRHGDGLILFELFVQALGRSLGDGVLQRDGRGDGRRHKKRRRDDGEQER